MKTNTKHNQKKQYARVERRVTRSMTTPVARRLRPLPSRVSLSPLVESISVKSKPTSQMTKGKQKRISVMKETTNRDTTVMTWDDYPPAPPSNSSIASDWLLNHPSICATGPIEGETIELFRRLDYRLRE